MSTRPTLALGELVDPLSDAIDAMHLEARRGATFDLVAPFALRLRTHAEPLSMIGVLRGSAAITVAGARIGLATAGDLILRTTATPIELRDAYDTAAHLRELATCPTRLEHDRAALATARFVELGFRISPLVRDGILGQLPAVMIAHPDDSPVLATAASMFRLEAAAPSAGSRALLGRLGEAIFIDILRREGERKRAAGVGHGNCGELRAYADPPLARALANVHAEPAKDWTLASLGRVAGLSRSAFAARFHAATGEPALAFITRWRMRRAAEILLESDAGIPDVARQVGYLSEASFTRAFVRALGTTPGRFRRAER